MLRAEGTSLRHGVSDAGFLYVNSIGTCLWHVSNAIDNQGVAMLRAEGTSLRQSVSDAGFI